MKWAIIIETLHDHLKTVGIYRLSWPAAAVGACLPPAVI